MSVKNNYFKMNTHDFEDYLNRLKQTDGLIHLLGGKFFYYPSLDIMYKIIELNKSAAELDALISSSFANDKNKYYKAFEKAEDRYEFGCLNEYVESIFEILINQFENTIQSLKKDKDKVNSFVDLSMMSKSEKKIYRLICEASGFSNFGVSNEEIMSETGVSKRTLMYSLDNLRKRNVIEDIRIGKYCFHKMV